LLPPCVANVVRVIARFDCSLNKNEDYYFLLLCFFIYVFICLLYLFIVTQKHLLRRL